MSSFIVFIGDKLYLTACNNIIDMTFKNIFMMQVGIFETNQIGKFLTHIDMYAIIKFKYEN